MSLKSEFLGRVKREIRSLPADDRQVLALACPGRLTYEEISTALSVPVETVKGRIVRAREKLRTRVFAEPVEPDHAEFLEPPTRWE